MSKTNNNTTDRLSLPEPVKYTVSAIICLIGLAILFSLSLLRESNTKKESDVLIPLVETSPVTLFEGDLDMLVSGTVVPYREIRVAAEVGGAICTKYPECEAGNFVKKGTKLLEIDCRDYELEIKTMKSEIRQAERTMDETEEEIRGATKNLEIAKSDLRLQQKEFARFSNIQGSLSEMEFDQAKRALLSSESQLTLRQNTFDMLQAKKERLKASMELIENRLEKAELNFSRTIIVAPDDGVIVRESVEKGDFVSMGQQLLVFEDTSRAEVECNLSQTELSWLRKHAPANTQLQTANLNGRVYQVPQVDVELFEQSDPGTKWIGKLERFDGIGLNETTKSIPCRIVVKEPVVETIGGQQALVRGMFLKCKVIIKGSEMNDKLAAFPAISVRPGDYVWVVRDERLKRFDVKVLDRTPVKQSLSDPDLIVVQFENSGLEIGDAVITSPLPQPIEGGQVKLVESGHRIAANDSTQEAADERTEPVSNERSEP